MSVSFIRIQKKKPRKVSACRSELLDRVNSEEREVQRMERCFDCLSLMDECESETNRSLDGMIAEMIADNETNAASEYVVDMVRSLRPELKLEANRILLLLEEAEMLKDRLEWERKVLKEEGRAVRDDMTQYEDYICNEQYYNFKNATWDALKNVGRDELQRRRSKLQKMRNDLNGKYQMLCQKIRVYQFLLSKLNEEEIQREQRCHALSLHGGSSKMQIHRDLIEYVRTEIDRTQVTEKFITNKLKQDIIQVKETWSQNILNVQRLGCTFDFVLQHRVNKGGSRGYYDAVVGIFEKEIPVFHADAICEKSMILMKQVFGRQRTRLEKEMDIYLWMTNAKPSRVPGASVLEQPKPDLTPQKPEFEKDAPKQGEMPKVQENASKCADKQDVEHCNQRIDEKRGKTKKQTKKLEEKTDELAKSMSEVKEVNKAILKKLNSLIPKIHQSKRLFPCEAKSLIRHKEIDETKALEDKNTLQETTEALSAFVTRGEDLENKRCSFQPADLSIEEQKRLASLQILKKLHSFLKRNEETRAFAESEEMSLNVIPRQLLSISIISQFLNDSVLKLRCLEISEMKRMETQDFQLRDVHEALMYLTNNEVITWADEDLCDEFCSICEERDSC